MEQKRKRAKRRKVKSDVEGECLRADYDVYDFSDEYDVNVKPTYQKPFNQYKSERY